MPALGTFKYSIRRSGSTDITSPPLGWVGSKAGAKGDLVILSSGVVDQAVTTLGNNIGAGARLALLSTPTILSTAPVNTPCEIEKFDDDTLIELPATTGGAATATSTSLIGAQREVKRVTGSGYYTVDVGSTTNNVVEIVAISPRYIAGEVGGTYLCRILPAARLA